MIDPTVHLERLPHCAMGEPSYGFLVADHLNRYQFCRQFVKGKIVLDAGCGIGYGACLLAEAGARWVDAIDISSEAIAMAHEYYEHPHVHFIAQDVLSFSATDKYEVITSFETIEHLADTEKYLSIMRNALKPDGLFFVSTPSRTVSNSKATRFDKPRNPYHRVEWTRDEFVDLLSGYFKVEEVYGQRPYYYKCTRIRTLQSVFVSKRLRAVLRLPEANYAKLSVVRRIHCYHEPVFLIAQCRKNLDQTFLPQAVSQ